MIRDESKTGRVFLKLNGSEKYYIFDRKAEKNQQDIAHCAALSFNKAIIGIAELSLIEKAGPSYRFASPTCLCLRDK